MFHNHYNIETLLSVLCSTPNFFDTLPLRSRHRISQQVVRNTRSYNSMTAWSQTFEIAVPNHSLDTTYWKFPFEAPGKKKLSLSTCSLLHHPLCNQLPRTSATIHRAWASWQQDSRHFDPDEPRRASGRPSSWHGRGGKAFSTERTASVNTPVCFLFL